MYYVQRLCTLHTRNEYKSEGLLPLQVLISSNGVPITVPSTIAAFLFQPQEQNCFSESFQINTVRHLLNAANAYEDFFLRE